MLAAVVREVTVVAVDHGDARPDESRDGEDGDPGAQRVGGVGVAHVVQVADRLDPGGRLGGFPVAAATTAWSWSTNATTSLPCRSRRTSDTRPPATSSA